MSLVEELRRQWANARDELPDTALEKTPWEDEEKESFERDRQRLELSHLQEQVESAKQDREERKGYAKKLYWLIAVWLASVLLLLIAHGLTSIAFFLSDSVILAIVGGTTLNVLGLFAIVTKYLFPAK